MDGSKIYHRVALKQWCFENKRLIVTLSYIFLFLTCLPLKKLKLWTTKYQNALFTNDNRTYKAPWPENVPESLKKSPLSVEQKPKQFFLSRDLIPELSEATTGRILRLYHLAAVQEFLHKFYVIPAENLIHR
jgi:hypothetical protein